MPWAMVPVLLLLIVAGAISAFFTIIFWKNRAITKGGIPLFVAMVAITLWAFSIAFSLVSRDPVLLFSMRVIEISVLVVIPVSILMFSLQYTGRIGRTTRISSWAPLLFVPVLTGTLLLMVPDAPLTLANVEGSPLALVFWVFEIYNIILILAGLAIIIQSYQSPVGIFKGQLACLLIAIMAPFLLHFAYVFRITPFEIIDLAPIGCIVTVVALAAGIERYGLFDLVPIEHGTVIRQVPVGIVILDPNGRIIEINPPALRMLGIRTGEVAGERIGAFLPPHETSRPIQPETTPLGRRYLIQRDIDGSSCHIEIRCIPLLTSQGERQGQLMVLSDITDQKLTEQSLNMARRNINLLTAITRHDILNQLTVIILHNEILRESVGEQNLMKSLMEQDKAAKNIRRQIAFTKDYEKLGENLPEWLDIEKIFVRHQEALGYDYLLYSIHVEGLEVFSDPLIDRVFYNLLDNSLRYGQKVTSIRLYTTQHLDGLTIVYEDNGVGIPANDKNRIFQRGYGRNSGFGLFFAKEILSITGITIRETGQENNGARFEILVPWGRFRFRRGGGGTDAGKP